MIITSLQGGLGNQMFQYAAGRRLALKHNTELKLDLSMLVDEKYNAKVTPRKFGLNVFNIDAEIASIAEVKKYRNLITRINWKLFKSLKFSRYIQETKPDFIPGILNLGDNRYIDGHWQSEKYFEDHSSSIRKDFQFKLPVGSQVALLESEIRSKPSIGVHVRRGDYVTNPAYNKLYGNTTMEYYNSAAQYISAYDPDAHYFVFSDDIEWCLHSFASWSNVTFVEKRLEATALAAGDILRLLSACTHHIISNSTFGWWGAWLGNHHNQIVVAPANWYADKSINVNDICPKNWIRK